MILRIVIAVIAARRRATRRFAQSDPIEARARR